MAGRVGSVGRVNPVWPRQPFLNALSQMLHLKDLLIRRAFLDPGTVELIRRIEQSFDDENYLAENADVAVAGVDPFLHFLSYGLMEGRAPSAGISNQYCRDELIGILGSDRILRRRLDRLRRMSGVSPGTLLRLAGRLPRRDRPFWAQQSFAANVIDLSYIRNSDDWQAGQVTIASAVRRFEEEFETRLLPFSHELVPDSDFYQALYGCELSALEIQGKWARSEGSGDTIVSIAHFMQHYCGDGSLVYDGFDHLDYIVRNQRVDTGLNQIQAFTHFIASGLEQGFRPPQYISPGLASAIDARLERLDETGSHEFCRAALKLSQAGVRSDVIERFACQHAIASGVFSVAKFETTQDRLAAFWTNSHLASANVELGQYQRAVTCAREALSHESGSVLALEKVHETVSL